MDIRVAAALYEKVSVVDTNGMPMKIRQFQQEAAVRLFNEFAERYEFAKLWCDEDIKGKAAQKAFETEIQRAHRVCWPNARFEARHRPSHTSERIQCADVIAYGLSRLERGLVSDANLRRALMEIKTDKANIVRGPMPWGIL